MAQQFTAEPNLLARLNFAAASFADWLVDLVFPPTCGHCGRVDSRFCHDCLAQFKALPLLLQPRYFDELDATCASGIQRGILAAAVKSFKYHDAVDLCRPLASRLTACLERLPWQIDLVAPVPLHADRELERGYNQSSLLGEQLARDLNLAFSSTCLLRLRDTSQQAQLAEAKRRKNVEGAFQASAAVAGKSVLLVDDVVTTGSTLAECALALRDQGASAVYALAVSSSRSLNIARR